MLRSCDRNVVSNFSICYTHPINITLHFECIPLISGTVGFQVLIEKGRSRRINWCSCSCWWHRYITDGWYLRVKSSNVCSQCIDLNGFYSVCGLVIMSSTPACFFGTIQKFVSLVWIKCKIFCRKSCFSCTYQFEYTFHLNVVPPVHKHVQKRV